MRDVAFIKEFDIGDEIQELYWIAGTAFNEASDCFICPVLRGVDSGAFKMRTLPIGMLPILSHGRYYHHGQLLDVSMRGILGIQTIADMSVYTEINSAEIPKDLYSFDDQVAGNQRLLKYDVDGLMLYIPTIELIRYLFLHNKTLANALMRPDGLMTLHSPLMPGFTSELKIDFTKEMPASSLTRDFAQEFAWLALDIDARRSWDSVLRLSLRQKYLTLIPPPLQQSEWQFRGIQHGAHILILELLNVTGKEQPCDKLIYSHPSLKQVITIRDMTGETEVGDDKDKENTGTGDQQEKVEYDFELHDDGAGSTSQANQKSLEIALKRSSFDRKIQIERLRIKEEREVTDSGKRSGEVTIIKKLLKVSAGEVGVYAELPPIEFKLLIQGDPQNCGDLSALVAVVNHMANLVPDREFSMAFCKLKLGKTISTANRHQRLALVVSITSRTAPPIILLDIDHAGDVALSLLGVQFKQPLTFDKIEPVIKSILDGLVDHNGHWDTSLEDSLKATCTFERFPKLMTPRDDHEGIDRSSIRAHRLAYRLRLLNLV